MSKELTFGNIIHIFYEQFPGLDVNDMQPNGPNQLYIWLKKSPINLIATYRPDTDTFIMETTHDGWMIGGIK